MFISGSKTVHTLPETVKALLNCYCKHGCTFLIGDCVGTDRLVQEYLFEMNYPDVVVYVSGGHIRNCVGDWPVRHIPVLKHIRGFAFYRQKDIAMAQDCDAAVMLWDGITHGTSCNIDDMQSMQKPFALFIAEEEGSGKWNRKPDPCSDL